MNGLDETFGKLRLPAEPGTAEVAAYVVNATETVFVIVFVILAILFMKNFINILPYVLGSITRPRMASEIEGSVRIARDRNIVALIFILPLCLILAHYDIYSPDFLDPLGPGARLLTVTAMFTGLLLLRSLLNFLLKPRNMRAGVFPAARKICYTVFVAAMILILTTLGILVLFHTPEKAIRVVMLVEMGLSYLILLLRRAQIISPYCNPFSLFLYLCALEIVPTGLFVASALIF